MSLTRRIIEGAQSQWSKLSSLVIVDDDPLSDVDSAVLLAELTARKAARVASSNVSAVATMAGATPADQQARRRAAMQRSERIGKQRAAQQAQSKASADDAFRRMKQQAAANGGGNAQSTGSGTNAGGNTRTAPKPSRSNPQLAEWYSVLGVAPGDDMTTIKSAYRQLMRKYHPDMHAGNPQKQKAANELSTKVTVAYNGLTNYLEKR